MVELDELPLVLCTERIETINVSGSYKVKSGTQTDIVSKYRKIAAHHPNLSLYQFFEQQYEGSPDEIIPHWVGGNGQPTYL